MILSMVTMGVDPWDLAEEKAKDPNMSLNGNPLRRMPNPDCAIVQKNMRRLDNDADAWSDPKYGEVYRAIRSMSLNKE